MYSVVNYISNLAENKRQDIVEKYIDKPSFELLKKCKRELLYYRRQWRDERTTTCILGEFQKASKQQQDRKARSVQESRPMLNSVPKDNNIDVFVVNHSQLFANGAKK